MEIQTPEPQPERAAYEPPAVVYEAPLEVRAGSPLGKILGEPIKGLSDPARLWTK